MGTHDITVLNQSEGVFEVKATSGDTHLGGEDIDNILTDYCLDEFKKKHNIDLSHIVRARRRVQTACERAKRTLSTQTEAYIEIDNIVDNFDMSMSLTRAKFENLCMSIFRRTITPIDDALHTAKLDKSQISEVILVGGSTRIPKVRELLSDYFNGKQLNMSVNPDEAVAYGAAIQAAILAGDKSDVLNELVILDATPLTLGIETAGNVMTPMIPRGTTIPTKKTNIFSTFSDNQTSCNVVIYEGERKMTRDCHKLGEFMLSGIPPAPRGMPQIEITYDVDANSILNVTAIEKQSQQKMSITIKSDAGHRSKSDIERMVQEAEKYAAEDKKQTDRIESKNKLESYIYQLKNSIKDMESKLDSNDNQVILSTIEKTIQWLNSNQDADQSTFDQKFEEVKHVIEPILIKMYGQSNTQQCGQNNQPSSTTTSSQIPKQPKIEEVD